VVTFTHKGVLVEVNGPSVVLFETQGDKNSCVEMNHQHGS
jgi:hypothetical protein